jgi:hypothetical protein
MAHTGNNINRISAGDFVQITWEVKDDDTGKSYNEWYDAVVKKIHRKDRQNRYVVCTVEYDDGDVDKSHIFWEKDYGDCWRFDNGEEEDEDNEEENDYEPTSSEEDDDETVVIGDRVLVKPKDTMVLDIDALTREVSCMRKSLAFIATIQFITYLPLWFVLYVKMYDVFCQFNM